MTKRNLADDLRIAELWTSDVGLPVKDRDHKKVAIWSGAARSASQGLDAS